MYPDRHRTADDVASCNLILFGTAETNPVLRRVARSLPPTLMKPGSIFIYPNPESPMNYLVIWSVKLLSVPAVHYGWTMPLNLLPDYLSVENNAIVSAGHFDEEWDSGSSWRTSRPGEHDSNC
jgi:hypothetical protein